MNALKGSIILMLSLYLFGCASPAQMEAMIYQGDVKQYDKHLKNEVNLSKVKGGEETNPAWTSEISNEAFAGALQESLKRQGLYSKNGKYQLVANLINVDQPMFGLDLTVTTHVRYLLKQANSAEILLDETIVAPHTATISDAFAAVARLRLANEGSGLKNIEGILNKLEELKIDPKSVSIAK